MNRFFSITLLALCACGGGGGGGAVPPVASVPPMAAVKYVALGDSITFGYFSSPGHGYADIVAQQKGYTLVNLGIPGEYSWNLIPDELPNIPPDAGLVSLFIGTNDEYNLLNQPQNETWWVQRFTDDLNTTIQGIHKRAPSARVILLTLPLWSKLQGFAYVDALDRGIMGDAGEKMNAAIKATGLTIVDLANDPNLYDPANYHDAVHPNDAGHAYIAKKFEANL